MLITVKPGVLYPSMYTATTDFTWRGVQDIETFLIVKLYEKTNFTPFSLHSLKHK